MKRLLAAEKWDKCLTDKDICNAILGKGILTNAGQIFELRNDLGIDPVSVRRIQLYSKQHKSA